MLISNKREFLARRLRDTGFLRILERLASRPGLIVLTYHRIGDPAGTSLYAPVVSATPDDLRSHMRELSRRYRMLNLGEAIEVIVGEHRLDRPAILVTFDDGTRDNALIAAPILRKEGVPSAFFLSTSLIESPRLPWYDHVAAIVNQTQVPILQLDRPVPLAIDLSRSGRRQAVSQIVQACLAIEIDTNDEAGVLDHLADRADVEIDADDIGRQLFMSWDDVKSVMGSGLAVGSHAHTHRKLTLLDEDRQRGELADSKAILEERLGSRVEALAYPYGWEGAFDATTERLAREVGYRVAFASVEGMNRPGATNPFAIRRINIGSSDSLILLRARLALQASIGRSLL